MRGWLNSQDSGYIDQGYLADLRTYLGNDTTDEIVEMFISNAESDIKKLLDLSPDGDATKIRHFAHDLKGMAGNVGATALENLAAAIEVAARDGSNAEAYDLIPGLSELWEGSVEHLQYSMRGYSDYSGISVAVH